MATSNPYELWENSTLLGTFRDSKPETFYFGQFFQNQMRSSDEWIDFEKIPVRVRDLADFVKPLGRGTGGWSDKVQGFRFKPANIVAEDAVDPLRPLTFQPGIDASTIRRSNLSPMERYELIKLNMMNDLQTRVERRWEWMRARAIIDGAVTMNYLDGSSYTVNFLRDSSHTEILTGDYWGSAGYSILDYIQSVIDKVANAAFGGIVSRVTMSSTVAAIVRKDLEILQHLDKTVAGGVHRVERGLVGAEKIYKFGELTVGGASGHVIELYVNDETYTDRATGAQVRYLGAKDVLFTTNPAAVNGYECFGRIVDKDAAYEAIPMFPKNFETGDRVKTEHLSVESAPLFVPINPNCTFKATVLA